MSSDYTSDPREKDWPTDDSFQITPDFPDPMSDMYDEYQSKEVTRAARIVEESFDEEKSQTHTSKWSQDLPSE